MSKRLDKHALRVLKANAYGPSRERLSAAARQAELFNEIEATLEVTEAVGIEPELKATRWLFADTVKGAKASAALYCIVSSARANGLEPYAYLRRLFAELPKAKTIEDFEAMIPFNTT